MTLEPGDPRHGTRGGYDNHACRCDLCRAANTEAQRSRRRRLGIVPREQWEAAVRAEALARDTHGTEGRYRNHGCRCEACTGAASAARRARWDAKPGAEAAYSRDYRRRRKEAAS